MLIPLLLTLFAHHKPQYRPQFPLRASRPALVPVGTVKGAAQFAPLPPPLVPPASHPTPALLPLQFAPRLDTPVQEGRDEADLIAAINRERETRGLGPLTVDPLLTATARAHSREMCALNYFDHDSPTPALQTPLDRYLVGRQACGKDRPRTALVGENLFYASVTDPVYNAGYAHTRLMASPGHRANILEPRFTKIGVGLYRDPEGRFWVTEMFLRDTQ